MKRSNSPCRSFNWSSHCSLSGSLERSYESQRTRRIFFYSIWTGIVRWKSFSFNIVEWEQCHFRLFFKN